LANDPKLILGQLAPYQSRIEGIAVESMHNWYWLVDGLMELTLGSDQAKHLLFSRFVRQGTLLFGLRASFPLSK
jgi:hypothetical protein